MAEIKTGGPAFPLENVGTEFQSGMNLRDYFAIHAPTVPDWYDFPGEPKMPPYQDGNSGLLVRSSEAMVSYRSSKIDWEMKRAVSWAYAYSDAMIAAREGGAK